MAAFMFYIIAMFAFFTAAGILAAIVDLFFWRWIK